MYVCIPIYVPLYFFTDVYCHLDLSNPVHMCFPTLPHLQIQNITPDADRIQPQSRRRKKKKKLYLEAVQTHWDFSVTIH